MTSQKLNPRTQAVRADTVRPGHVVIESDQHPAVVVRTATRGAAVTLWCRYVWQSSTEPIWPLGRVRQDSPVWISKEK